jgi:hypothetical protein
LRGIRGLKIVNPQGGDQMEGNSKVRIMLLLEDEDAVWDRLTLSQFIKGYSEKDSIYDNL